MATQAAQKSEQQISRSTDDPTLASWIARLTLLIYITAAVAGGVLASGFAAQAEWGPAATGIGLIGLTIVIEQIGTDHRLGELAFCGFVGLAALSPAHGIHPLGALVATTAAVASWDLHHFRYRLLNVDRVYAPSSVVRQHLERLASAVGLGFGLGLAALLIQVSYGVGVVAALVLVSIVGLTRAVGYLRRKSD